MMILAIIQARMGSNRLPGKVLKPVLGKPLLQLLIERVSRATSLDRIIVATSVLDEDDPIERLADELGLDYFRGSQDDVLDRYYQAARHYKPDHVVRLTGDCPLHDPAVIDHLVRFYLDGGFDLACNTIRPTYPDGLDAWIMSFEAIEEAWSQARLPSEREHVTLYIQNRPERFKLGSLEMEPDLSSMRWTVDEKEDFEFVKQVYERLYLANPEFSTSDILALLDQYPWLRQINNCFIRDEGLLKSLEQDRRWVDEHGAEHSDR